MEIRISDYYHPVDHRGSGRNSLLQKEKNVVKGCRNMKAYDRENGFWNEVYSECQPVDLRKICLTVEPGFDGVLHEFGEKTSRVLDFGCGTGDKKYCVTDENGTRYLLRVSDIAQHDTKRSEFNMMKQVVFLGIPMCQPVEFGTCEDGVYSIQSWIDGEDAEQVMSSYSDTEQYVYGLEAGRILRKIHSIPAPATQEDWEIRFNRKMDYKIQKYGECPIKYENGQAFIDYINENRHLLKGRP